MGRSVSEFRASERGAGSALETELITFSQAGLLFRVSYMYGCESGNYSAARARVGRKQDTHVVHVRVRYMYGPHGGGGGGILIS